MVMNKHKPSYDRQISRAELAALTEWGDSRFTLVEPREVPDDEAIVTGRIHYHRFRSGLEMHCSDTVEIRDLVTQVVAKTGLSCYLFLQGSVGIRVGMRSFALGANTAASGTHSSSGLIVNYAERDLLTRISQKGQHIRKLVITAPKDWCDNEAKIEAAENSALKRLWATHLASAPWKPSFRIVSLAEQILRASAYNDVIRRLFIESRSLEILGEALSQFSENEGSQQVGLRTREYERIRAIAEHLSTAGSTPSSIEDIARDAGMSSSSLQRYFKAAYGVSVFEFIRNARLDEAKHLLMQQGASVSEAAYRAGYSSAANFTTAFKRRFGILPKHVKA
jgi:AraC-like DNA-binding protein